ncbi:unnamed protein product, partial [Allacma fusca]
FRIYLGNIMRIVCLNISAYVLP